MKIFEGEMIVRTPYTTPLQIFSEILLYSLDISKGLKIQTTVRSQSMSVKYHCYITVWPVAMRSLSACTVALWGGLTVDPITSLCSVFPVVSLLIP